MTFNPDNPKEHEEHEERQIRKVKSFSLKRENARKIERIAYEEERKQSDIIDQLIEEYPNGDR